MKQPSHLKPKGPVIVIDIGNSTTDLATWHNYTLKTPLSVNTDNREAFAGAFKAHVEALPESGTTVVVIGSVVPSALEWVCAYVSDDLNQNALVVGDTIPLPMDVGVDDPKAIGVDRVGAGAAAYEKLQAACIVVDFGSATTVDLVDDDGVLLGGAILPGLDMQLASLHEHTAALPKVSPGIPDSPYGRNTVEAIQTGVYLGLAGAVRWLVEGYATSLNRWPQVLATGGDLELLLPHCDFIDTPVKDLTLRGIGLAFSKHLAAMGA